MEDCEALRKGPSVVTCECKVIGPSPPAPCASTPTSSSQLSDCAPRLGGNINFNNILHLKYSDLPSSCYNYFLYGFRDERDFEEFKQDLRDFLRLKRECSAADSGASSSGVDCADGALSPLEDNFLDLNEELQVICRPNSVLKNRRRSNTGRQYLKGLSPASSTSSSTEEALEEEGDDSICLVSHFCGSDASCSTGLEPATSEGALETNVGCQTQTSTLSQSDRLCQCDRVNTSRCICCRHLLPVTSERQLSEENRPRPDSFGLRQDFDRRSGLYENHRHPKQTYRQSGLPVPRSSINTTLMDFINGDEHFREFDRVFETVNLNGGNQSSGPPSSPSRAQTVNGSNDNDGGDIRNAQDDNGNEDDELGTLGKERGPRDSLILYRARDALHRPSYVDNMLADFFDNDETFQEFEQEFQKFKLKRRSQMLLRNLSNMGSSKDIFGDVKAFCDRTLQQQERQKLYRKSSVKALESEGSFDSTQGDAAAPVHDCSPQESQEQKVTIQSHEPLIWRSVEDWERMLRKMKRNSRLLLDSKHHPKHQRRSVHGFSHPTSSHQQQYDRTQSLADLSGCHVEQLPGSSKLLRRDGQISAAGFPADTRHSCCTLGPKSVDCDGALHHKHSSVPNLNSHISKEQPNPSSGLFSVDDDNEDSSGDYLSGNSEQWENNLSKELSFDNEEARYSSTSTLCSSNGDVHNEVDNEEDYDENQDETSSCSFSCSIGSDLHIHEEGDYTDDDLDAAPVARGLRRCSCPVNNRTQSLMELSTVQHQEDPASLQATQSAGNLHFSNTCDIERGASSDVIEDCQPQPGSRPACTYRASSVPYCSARSPPANKRHPYRSSSSAACEEATCDILAASTTRSPSWSIPRPPSAVSDSLSDLESDENYDTATSDLSDLSDQFSTAKSDLSSGFLAAASALSSQSRSFDLDLSDISAAPSDEEDEDDWTPGSSPPEVSRQWARHGVKDITARYERAFGAGQQNLVGGEATSSSSCPYSRGHCHSYHGKELQRGPISVNSNTGGRPRSCTDCDLAWQVGLFRVFPIDMAHSAGSIGGNSYNISELK
ncbi:ras association domain-containing protein 5 [Plakobranchus ocellatus]|uniref:Ras association domain-containing protein 5 n=1 Tax=Plakobranchus ocellatus TaxID=259542 RepID=A0AAV3Z744_9GAST|nr:ras association domain-containing protein 5 [Plakobranchus ocellatus]